MLESGGLPVLRADTMRTVLSVLFGAILLAGCAEQSPEPPAMPTETESPDSPEYTVRETVHRNDDDLLTAGLGLAGLRLPSAPLDDDLDEPARLRRMAIHSNWRGLADLTASGGFGDDSVLPEVPGREFQAFLQLPERSTRFRVLLQVPDSFDPASPCLAVAPVSGSRGIYGAVPVAGPWALPRGCAVVYTDKGAGTDLFDHASDTGVALDGTRAARGTAVLGLEPTPAPAPLVSVPHAHSGSNPEAAWGFHVLEAATFGIGTLQRRFPDLDARTMTVIGIGISNGGGAMLRALELGDDGLFDAAIVAAPNITPHGARPLFDYASQAALFQPCLLADTARLGELPFGNPMLVPAARARCSTLHAAGLIEAPTPEAARAVLVESGFEAGALEQAAVNATLDIWRSVAALYASAYLQTPVDAMPCGYSVAPLDDGGKPLAAPPEQRRQWWATTSGVVPGGGLEWIDGHADRYPDDPAFGGLKCLRDLWTGDGEDSHRLRAAIDDTRGSALLPDIPIVILHGRQDGLIPAAFSARPYAEAARANGADRLDYREIDGAQHFDSLVPFPGMAERYRPLIPMVWAALDEVVGKVDADRDSGAS